MPATVAVLGGPLAGNETLATLPLPEPCARALHLPATGACARSAQLALQLLPADALACIGALVGEGDALCWRASCAAFREALVTPARTPRMAMLRTSALAAWAWELRGFRSAEFDVDPAAQATLCALAARAGGACALAWLRERGCAWDKRTCAAAAEGGHLHALQWARAHGCEWDSGTCSAAAGGGHLAVLQWAREHGCAWGSSTCSAAAAGGHLHVLQWARALGCEWGSATCFYAAANGHLSVLQWAVDAGCPLPRDRALCVSVATCCGHAHVAAWLRAR